MHLAHGDVEVVAVRAQTLLKSILVWAAILMLAMLNGGDLDGRRILREASLKEMWNPTVAAREGRIGLGWFSLKAEGEDLIWHGGADSGFRARLMLIPARRSGVIVLANSDRVNTNKLAQLALRAVVDLDLPAK